MRKEIPRGPKTTVTLLFEDLGGKTRLTLHNAIFESVTARDMHQSGWSSCARLPRGIPGDGQVGT